MNQTNKKITRKELLLSMERVIAQSCHNGSIRNYGAWGVREPDGRFFRYPLTLFNSESENRKSKSPDAGISMEALKNSYYLFGKNELHVIEALDFILTSLEKEYGLNIYRTTSEPIPEGYRLLNAETIFEAEIFLGASGGGWESSKPSPRDVYESPDGTKYVLIKGALHPIRSPAQMKEIVESCDANENLWHRFESPRFNEKYYSFVEFGDGDDIKELYTLMRGQR